MVISRQLVIWVSYKFHLTNKMENPEISVTKNVITISGAVLISHLELSFVHSLLCGQDCSFPISACINIKTGLYMRHHRHRLWGYEPCRDVSFG